MKKTALENAPQSQPKIPDLGNAYAAFNRGDIDGVLKPLDPQM